MKMKTRIGMAFAAGIALVGAAQAAVTFPDLFKDHAIVQRDAACAIWGRAERGEQVTVALGGVTGVATAGSDGWWCAKLDTRKLGDGPFTLTATAASGRAVSQDILVGEVWLAAGQSNMEFTMKGGFGPITDYAERERACVGRPIRMFRSPRRKDSDPFKGDEPIRYDAKGTWRVISPATLGSVTAVGYTFIDTLQKTIGGAAGVVDVSWSGTRCWAWMPRHCIDAHPELAAEFARQRDLIAKGEEKKVNKPVIRCWNNQFMPVANLSCRGIIWYQGCCDSGLPDARNVYPKWLSYMVAEWRREMGKPNIPFLYCQLAGWGKIESDPAALPSRANLREGQRRAQSIIPKSAMAVILDNSEYEIHGRFKGPAGDRLAALALNRVYGRKNVVCASPNFARATFSDDAAFVRFDIEGSPLKAEPIRTSYTWNVHSNDVINIVRRSSPASELEGFTICDANGTWHWADAKIVAPDTVKVWAAGAKNPTAVRYNMRSQGFGNLYNAAGLPASCFTTEDAPSFDALQAEFAKYHRQITGRDPSTDMLTFAVVPKISTTGKDAYRITSTRTGAKIVGSNLRSVWYGLYDLLERRGGCHWFWDEDVVPKKGAIDLKDLNVTEEAHFEYRAIRYFAHRGLTRFQAEHWGPDEWRREIDWCLKRRLNVLMLRIGQDDLFQRAFPETCAYPDPAKELPGHGRGYDDRSLFWSLQYRGKLRERIQRYAFARGLMVPEDFGTMSHWYSRTPEDFLAKKNPSFLPQATHSYSEKNGLVWDVRDDKWVDEYWKLTTTAVNAYGEGKNQQLLHTIGLGERYCFTNRADNLALKVASLKKFLARAHRTYPNAKTLIAGWDFYISWRPDEVRELVRQLDPTRDIIWDYEGDSTRDYMPGMMDLGGNNFTKWDIVGKFPYTYSVFLAYESALDIRANYPLIEARQKVVQNDPKCAGYIFWPESSHTDTLLLRHFTANAWSREALPIEVVLDEFCQSRYGERAAAMKAIWQKVIPLSWMLDWSGNYGYLFTRPRLGSYQYADKNYKMIASLPADAASIFAALATLDWQDAAIRRDAIDLARTTLDRLIIMRTRGVVEDYILWRKGARDGADLVGRMQNVIALTERMAGLLALHTDYSLWESYQRLDKVEKIRNPNFSKVLFDNASCGYCQSHQYELARYWYVPRAREFAQKLAASIAANDRKAELVLASGEASRQALMQKSLESLRPTVARTPENYRKTLKALCDLVE